MLKRIRQFARPLCMLLCLPVSQTIFAQVMTNDGAFISIKTNTAIQAGEIQNNSGGIENYGSIYLTGDWKNHAAFSDNSGTIIFNGGSLFQKIFKTGGETFYNFEFNNTGDSVVLNNPLQVNGKTNATKGLLHTTYDINFLGEVLCGTGKIQAWGGTITYPLPAQRIIAGIYYNLTLKGNSVKQLCGNVRVLNKLTIEAGTLEIGEHNLIVDGPSEIAGTIKDSDDAGTNIFKGQVELKSGASWDFNGDGNVEFQNGLINNGSSFISGTGSYRFTTTSQNISGTTATTFDCKVFITNGITFTNELDAIGTGLTLNNTINGINSGSTFKNNGIVSYRHADVPMENGILDATASGNIFRYSGNNQKIASGTVNGRYDYLEITGTGTKTFYGDVFVARNLTIENNTTLAFGDGAVYTMTIEGDLIASSGNIDMRDGFNRNHVIKLYGTSNDCANLLADDQSTVEYLGNDDGQKVFASQNYRNLSFANGSKILMGNVKVSGNIFTLAAYVNTATYEIYLASDNAVITRTSGAVAGKFKRKVERTGVNYIFPTGTDTSYNSLTINYSQISEGDYLVEFLASDPGTDGLPLDDAGVDIHDRFTKGHWKTQALNSLSSNVYNIELNAEKLGIDVASRIIKKEGSLFVLSGVHGTLSGTSITRSGMSGISDISTIFAIGKGRPKIYTEANDSFICYGTEGKFTIIAGGHPTIAYQWYKTGDPQKLTDDAKYSGTTTHTLVIKNSIFNDAGSFYCVITDPAGNSVTTKNISLTVNKIPDVILPYTRDTICDNTIANLQILPAISDTTYQWTASSESGITGASNGNGILISQLLKNHNSYAANVVYAIQATGPTPTFCQSEVVTSTIVVNPTPHIFARAIHDTICYNEGAVLNVSSLVTVTNTLRYHLSVENNGGITGFRIPGDYDPGDFSDNLLNATEDTQKITYIFKPYISTLNCEYGIESHVVVSLNPQPKIQIEAIEDTIICFNEGVKIKVVKTNPTHIGNWKYDVNATASSSAVKGFTTQATGLTSDLSQTSIINMADSLEWIDYIFTPRIENPRSGLINCADGEIKKIRIYINPKPDMSIVASEDTLCYDQLISFNITRKNGNIKGFWKYNLSTTASDPNVTGYTGSLIDADDVLINNQLKNATTAKQTINYHFIPAIKDPRISKDYCAAGYDTTIIIAINPEPLIEANIDDLLYCDSSTVNFDILSKNGAVIGEKYYLVETEYNSALVKPDREIDGYHPVGLSPHRLINLTNKIQTVTYNIKAVIRDPKGNNPNDYCQSNVPDFDTTITLEVLPALKAELVPFAYKGNWNISCNGEANGSINLTLSGGMAEKGMTDGQAIYSWSNNETTKDIKNLRAGNYSVRVQDTKSCMVWNSIVLKEPEKLKVDAVVQNQVNCSSLREGKIVATRSGGTLPYYLGWTSGSDTILRNDTVAKDLSLGEYFVHLKDANGCYTSDFATVYNSGEIIVNFVPSEYTDGKEIYGVSCAGATDGFIEPDVFQETGVVYNFQWFKIVDDNLVHIPSTKNSLNNAGPGRYMLMVFNNADCEGHNTIELTEPRPANISSLISKGLTDEYQISCHNSTDGAIKVTATGGYNRFSYKWESSVPLINDTLPEISQLDSGTYYLTVKDRWNQYQNIGECLYHDTFTLKKPDQLRVDTILSKYGPYNVSCAGTNDGWIDVKLSGGVPAYTYLWKDAGFDQVLSSTTNRLEKLYGGKYILEAGYGEICSSNFEFNLIKPAEIENKAVLSTYPGAINISCFNGSNGFIKTNASGGIPPYSYKWTFDNGGNLPDKAEIENLKAGKYTLRITDKNKCTFDDYYELTQATKVESEITPAVVSCNSDGDGSAIVSGISGGTAPYTYLWSTSDTSLKIENLFKGEYSVIVKDINLCSDTAYTKITEPEPLKLKLHITSDYHGKAISCFGNRDASLFAEVTGGTRPYRFNWLRMHNSDEILNLPNSDSLKNLPYGKYYLALSDNSKCSARDSIEVSQPDSLTLRLDVSNVSCFNVNNGSILSTAKGGTLPYSFDWSNDSSEADLNNLGTGKYSLILKDVNNCTISDSATITQPLALTVYGSSKSPYCPATKNGWISLEVNGGTLPYNIHWNSGQKGSKLDNLSEFNYIYTIKDSNNCELSDTIELIALHTTCLDVPSAFSPNNDGINDTWNILAGDPENLKLLSELFPKAIVEVYNRWGDLIYQSEKGYTEEWDGRSNGSRLPMDSYYYSIDLGDGSEKWIGIISIIK